MRNECAELHGRAQRCEAVVRQHEARRRAATLAVAESKGTLTQSVLRGPTAALNQLINEFVNSLTNLPKVCFAFIAFETAPH